jgi:hypothetical protein
MIPERNPVPAAGWLPHLWSGWKRVGKTIGDLQARVLLTGFYFLIVGPFALLVRLSSDPLALKQGSRQGWRVRNASPGGPLERAQRQF